MLAEITFPNRYRAVNLWDRFKGTIGLAKPGPRPRSAEYTYRGTQTQRVLSTIGEYRLEPIGFTTLELMRHHPAIKLGLTIKAAPILTALREAKVECRDERIAAFIKAVFVEPWLLRVGDTSIMPSYAFGTAPHEKVWESKKVYVEYVTDDGKKAVAWDDWALVYKKVKYVNPNTLDRFLLQPGTYDFDGFVQTPLPGNVEKPVAAWKAFVYSNRFIFGGFWGESELRDAYPFWYYSEFFRALLADYLRYRAIPPIIGYAPSGVRMDETGTQIDCMKRMGETLQKIWEGLVAVLPNERNERGDLAYEYRELQLGQYSDVFIRAIEDLDTQILRALVVPERVVTQSQAAGGSYAQAQVHEERMLDAAKKEVDTFVNDVNAYLIPQLVEDHFGANAPECRIYVRAVSEALKAKLHSVLITILQNDKGGIFTNHVDFADLLDTIGIPYATDQIGLPVPQVEEPAKMVTDEQTA